MKTIILMSLALLGLQAFAQQDSSYSSPDLGDVPFVEVRSYELNQYCREYHQLASWVNDRFEKKREAGMPFDSIIYEIELVNELSTLAISQYPSVVVDGQIVEDAMHTNTLDSSQITHLLFILNTRNFVRDPQKEPMPDLNCIPVYRDALVFYDEKGEIVGEIDICFGCGYFKINGEYLWVEKGFLFDRWAFWKAWESFFHEELGHPTWRERHSRN